MNPQELISALASAMSSGRGLLDARALWASIVGPQSLAMAQSFTVELSRTDPAEITKNLGANDSYIYVGVCLPSRDDGLIVPAIFSRKDQIGDNTGIPATLISSMIAGNNFATGFAQLISPGDQLYAKLGPTAPNETQRVVVAGVVF